MCVDIFEVMCCVLITDCVFRVNSVLKGGLFVIGDVIDLLHVMFMSKLMYVRFSVGKFM